MKTLMKVLCAVLVLLLPSGGAAYAQSKISGNQLLQKQVTVTFTDASVKDVLSKLQSESGIRVVYKATDIERLKPLQVVLRTLLYLRFLTSALQVADLPIQW